MTKSSCVLLEIKAYYRHSKLLLLAVNSFGVAAVAFGILSTGADATIKEP